MSTSYENELVVVSGASTGLGAATARALADSGFAVLAGVRREQDAAGIRQERVTPVLLDVTVPEHLAGIAERVRADGRVLRAVVNNAGLAANAPLETMPMATWRGVFDVNVFGLIGLTQALLPHLRAGGGRVVNISSIGGRVAMPAYGAYSGSKFAVEAISDALRQEVAGQGVRVVVVEPGGMRTEMGARGKATAQDLLARMSPEQRDLYQGVMEEMLRYADTFDVRGVPAAEAARTVVQAVTARRPRTRYTIGREAAFLSRAIRFLPDRTVDRMIAGTLRRSGTSGRRRNTTVRRAV